jgi:hypothetical protein
MSDKPVDLQTTPQPDTDKDYFNFKATGLKIDRSYAIKFQWIYNDGTLSDWSPGYFLATSTENVPVAPSATVPSTAVGSIPVTLSVFPANTKRVDIYVIGGPTYGSGKVVDSFLSAGTKTISISEPGVYQVVLIAVTPSGVNGDPTNTFTVTVSGSSVDTTVIPGAPTSVVVAGFNEPSDPLNRTGYVNVSFVAGSGSKGHSIGLWTSAPGSTDPVRIIPADGTSTKVEGLFVGSSYYFRVRSFNQFNNPSAWVAPALNYPVTIPGSTLVPGQVTVSGSAAPKSIVVSWGDPASNASLVTSGGYYEVKLYTNSNATGTPLETRKSWSNQASFSGLTTGTSYWVTVQPYTAGSSPVAGTVSSIYGPLVPTAIDNPDLKGDFILASNQLQVGGTSGANDIHLSAYTKTVGALSTAGRIYIGGPETSTSVAVGIYNDSGTPFYADNLGRFSLGDKLTWSGNLSTPQLNVKGTIDVTGASTFSSYVLAGATSSSFIGIGYQVPYRLSSVLQSGANGLTGIVINSSGTAANSDYIKSDGTFRLAGGLLTFIGGTLAVQGNITANSIAANTDLSGLSITGTTGTFGGVTINSSGISSTNFSVTSTGILSAAAGTIGGWDINGTQLRSTGTNSITLNPNTPKIALLVGGVEKITIDPTEGIVGPNKTVGGNTGPAFKFSPNGTAEIRGTIYAENGIFSGSISSEATITGGTFVGGVYRTIADPYLGSLEISSTGSVIKLKRPNGVVSGEIYQFNDGNEIIFRHGNTKEAVGYPTNASYMSLSPTTLSLGFTGPNGFFAGGLTMQYSEGSSSPYSSNFFGNVNVIGDGSTSLGLLRNISSGSTAISQSQFGYVGDIYIQY